MWAGIFRDTIAELSFIGGNLNGAVYHNLLQEFIQTLITDLIENAIKLLQFDDPYVYFQQDGAPPYYSRLNRERLNDLTGR